MGVEAGAGDPRKRELGAEAPHSKGQVGGDPPPAAAAAAAAPRWWREGPPAAAAWVWWRKGPSLRGRGEHRAGRTLQ